MHESRRIDHEQSRRATIEERAKELGFDAMGVARADEPIDVDHARYVDFLRNGFHGEMAYLADHVEARRRLDQDAILPGAKSVLCFARRYARPDEEAVGASRAIARYARGRDYHSFLRKRLRRLADFVRSLEPDAKARAICDIEPVLERVWAARAGLGFVGKNGLIIVPGQGSYVLLGEIITTIEIAPDTPIAERCGSCTRCLDACPTDAFAAPFVLDARKCISYLTIEAKGAPPEPLRSAMGEHLFGCDDCQSVCPFNRTALAPVSRTSEHAPLPEWQAMDMIDFVRLPDEAFDRITKGSPLRRAHREGLARNAALVAANRLHRGLGGEKEERCLREALTSEDASVREVAEWGMAGVEK